MKRQQKYRAWHKEDKYWMDQNKLFQSSPNYQNPFMREDIELIEFTGLHDKNKKEVFEGDILKLQYPLNYGYAGIHNQEIIVTISFENGSFWFTGEGYTDCNWHFYNEYEIIGNIYEHKHLIK